MPEKKIDLSQVRCGQIKANKIPIFDMMDLSDTALYYLMKCLGKTWQKIIPFSIIFPSRQNIFPSLSMRLLFYSWPCFQGRGLY